MDKQEIRKKILEKRKNLSKDLVEIASQKVCDNLKKSKEILNKKSIVVYSAYQNEIDLRDFVKFILKFDEKQIYLPKFDEKNCKYGLSQIKNLQNDLKVGKYGILEPKEVPEILGQHDINKIECWLIPGVCFDKNLYRLGRGKGCYDRLLKRSLGMKIGIAYNWQIIDKVPVDNWDIRMDIIINEKGLL